jgi:hypothetical protein
MKAPNLLLKLAAVASSVLLASGAVAYRAGAFNGIMATSPQPADSGSNAALEGPASPQPTPAGTTAQDLTIMYSSKSGAVIPPTGVSGLESPAPAPSQPTPPNTTPPAPIIMSGSKSFAPAITVPGLTPANAQQPFLPQTSKPPQ